MREAGIHAIIQKVHADAELHSGERHAQIKEKADREIDRERAISQGEQDRRREIMKNRNEYEYALLYDRMSSRYHRELRTYRRQLIDEIFEAAAAKLRAASREECAQMFEAAVKGLKGNYTLYIGELSKGKLGIRDMEKAKEKEKAKGGGLDITLSQKTIPGKSGFLLRNDTVEYNCLFEDLIEDKKDEQAATLLHEVFGDA